MLEYMAALDVFSSVSHLLLKVLVHGLHHNRFPIFENHTRPTGSPYLSRKTMSMLFSKAMTTAWVETIAWLVITTDSTLSGEMSKILSFCFRRKHSSFWVIKVPGVLITSCIE